MNYQYAAVSTPGRVRSENQDHIFINGAIRTNEVFGDIGNGAETGLFAVADGMGGEANGARAARCAVQCLQKNLEPDEACVLQAFYDANEQICSMIRQCGWRMGTTLVCLLLHGEKATVINIGDSRCYQFRCGQLMRLSRDHTLLQQMINLGVLNPQQETPAFARHRLTQHLGIFDDELTIQPYVGRTEAYAGTLFLLCSDGLTDMLSDAEIERVLAETGSVEKQVKELFRQAMNNGGKDNISVVLVRIE